MNRVQASAGVAQEPIFSTAFRYVSAHKVAAIGMTILLASWIYLNRDAIQKAWNKLISSAPALNGNAKTTGVAQQTLPQSPKSETFASIYSLMLSEENSSSILQQHESAFFRADVHAYCRNMERELSEDEKAVLYNEDIRDFRSKFPTYRATRVHFSDISPPINANWILPDALGKRLVITDAPYDKHLDSFWQTVGRLASDKITIIMISHQQEEGRMWDKYWPENDKYDGGKFELHVSEKKRESQFNHRTMILKIENTVQVEHFHFDQWEDGSLDVSTQVLGDLIYKVADEEKPLIVHCSAGINRSGVVAAAYIAVRKIIKEYQRDVSQLNSQTDPHQFMRDILIQLRDRKVGRSPYVLAMPAQYILLHAIVSYICKEHFKQEWKHFPLK